jgi:hypothetical protein
MTLIEPADLGALHADIETALEHGDDHELDVVGWGEISLAVGWPTHAPQIVAKRMPPFPSRDRFDRYAALIADYVDVLTERGVEVAPTEVHDVEDGGAIVAYVVQPHLDPERLATRVLSASDPSERHPVIDTVVEAVLAVVDDRHGLDAQLSNWIWDDGRAIYLDVSTPFLRDPSGTDRMDFGILVDAYPKPLRGMLKRFALPGILARYHDPRSVLLDVASNLTKERLEAWRPQVLAATEGRVAPPLTDHEVHEDYRSDARMWATIQRIRQADRAWHRLRGRTYPYLLPGHIDR